MREKDEQPPAIKKNICSEKQAAVKRHKIKRRNKKRLELFFALLLCFIVFWFLGEFTFFRFMIKIWLGEWGILVAGIIIPGLIGLLVNEEMKKDRPADRDFITDVKCFLNAVMLSVKHKTAVKLLAAILTLIYAPAVLAQNYVAGSICVFFEEGVDFHEGIEACKIYRDSKKQQEGLRSQPQDTKPEAHEKQEDEHETGTVSANDALGSEENRDPFKQNDAPENIEWFAGHPESEQKEARKIIVSKAEQNVELVLSKMDYDVIFFQTGEYAIKNWNDEEEIYQAVNHLVEDKIECCLENKFDDEEHGAPPQMRTEVDDMSRLDAKLTELKDKKHVMEVRDYCYQNYPKYSLAKLLAEDNNGCALAYWCQDGREETVRYYYGQAVIWLLESLKFEMVSNNSKKNVLLSVSQRYADIAYTTSGETVEKFYALKLEAAFLRVSNNY